MHRLPHHPPRPTRLLPPVSLPPLEDPTAPTSWRQGMVARLWGINTQIILARYVITLVGFRSYVEGFPSRQCMASVYSLYVALLTVDPL